MIDDCDALEDILPLVPCYHSHRKNYVARARAAIFVVIAIVIVIAIAVAENAAA